MAADQPQEHPPVGGRVGLPDARHKPVLDKEGTPVRLCEGLWDRATRQALKKAILGRRPFGRHHSNREYLLTGILLCGQCHSRLYTQTSKNAPPR